MKNLNVKFKFDPVLFGIADWICRVLALLALLASVILLFSTLGTFVSSGLSVPRYGVEDRDRSGYGVLGSLTAGLVSPDRSRDDRSTVGESYVQFTAKYGVDVENTVKRHGFGATTEETNEHTKQILELLQGVPERWRKSYLSGWDSYLKNGLDALDKKDEKKTYSPSRLTGEYNLRFHRAIGELRLDDAKREAARIAFFMALLSSLMTFVIAIIVPVLISIERNTRPLRSGAGEAKPVQALPVSDKPPDEAKASSDKVVDSAAKCPNCAATITSNDAFCTECGTRLT
ncbi:MAG: zinc ribbon domain-containing protein [Betaproteobacteria bacterium]|nr:zinc ribbon domain-containing protein [Betaproteobacteria bacterium]